MKEQERGLKIPRKSRVFLVAALVLMVAITAGGTLAWLMTNSNSMTNNFVVPEVTPIIYETFSNGKKSNVYVKNEVSSEKGIDVYIRVALVPTWETADGNSVAPMPAGLSDLDITWGSNWLAHSDGYYYYKEKVAPGANTSNLIESATVKIDSAGAMAGYRMNLQVLAEAIQATEPAVKEAWSETVWDSLRH